jgi:hypothetical protein
MVKIFALIFPRDNCLGESEILIVYGEFPSLNADNTAVLLEYFRITTDGICVSH